MTVDNHHTLRGHNGDPGMIAQVSMRFSAMDERLNDMAARLDALKDVPQAIDTWKRYPSLTWMVRHQFKQMAIITTAAVVATIAFGFPDPARGEQIRQLIELLFAKWLRL